MKAFVIPQAGAHAVEPGDVPVPKIDSDELLVRVLAVGGGVCGHLPGDRIAFVSSMQPKGGTWAEFAAVKAHSLILPLPESLGFVEAAAVPVAGNTILRAFTALASVPAGGSLFISGGSGAIGTFAIQLARRRGWRIGASSSEANHDYMLSLGAEMAVDYHTPNWAGEVLQWMPGGVDAVVAVPPGTSSESLPVVKDGGSLVSISGDGLVTERGVKVGGIPYQADVRDGLVQLMTDIADGEVRAELERVYPFEEALAALAKVQTRHARGKIVLRLGWPARSI